MHIEIAYRSDLPLRLQARGYFKGEAVNAGQMMNASVAHPAGKGRALVWIAFHKPATVDEIRITAHDASWRPLRAISLPADIRWSVNGARFDNPSWVGDLLASESRIDAATRAASESETGDSADIALGLGIGFGLPVFLILQTLALRWFKGGWRLAALLPAGAMCLAALHAVLALASGSNLWPILLILGAPPACLWLATLFVLRGVTNRFA